MLHSWCLAHHLTQRAARPPRLLRTLLQLLGVLRGALALQNPRLADPALSCMHKLVAYAYLQGETSTSGRMDDEANFVTQVGAAPCCGQASRTRSAAGCCCLDALAC